MPSIKYQTLFFDSLRNHNLKKMLDAGLRVMVNSDDPAYFGGYLNTNLIETSKALNLSLEDVKNSNTELL